MKILFIYAPRERKKIYGKNQVIGSQVPLGILYIASYLRERLAGLEIKAIDGSILGYANTLADIRSFSPDVLCVSYSTLEATGAYRLIDELKNSNPEVFVIVGGPHVTALPTEALKKSNTDVEVIGEGEQTAFELVSLLLGRDSWKNLDLSAIDGIAFHHKGEIQITSPRKFIADLDTIPFPARDLVDLKNYQDWAFSKKKDKLQTNILMSRGCPFSCTFCANAVWRSGSPRYRVRSPKNIVDEMEFLVKEFGVGEFVDSGDDFNIDLANSIAVCEEIKNRKLDIAWHTCLRAHPVTDELARALAESGCWLVYLGIESCNPTALRGIKKQATPEQFVDACRTLKKYGIKVFGLFMLFNAWEEDGELKFEDAEMSNNTLDFASRLLDQGLLDFLSWSQTTPYPGSELYGIALRHGLVRQELLDDWNAWSWAMWLGQVMQLPGIDPREQMDVRMRGNKVVAWHTFKGSKDVRHLLRYYGSRIVRSQLIRLGMSSRL